jgi:hypothetical protein
VQQALADERRHCEWVLEALEGVWSALSGSDDPSEIAAGPMSRHASADTLSAFTSAPPVDDRHP